MGLDRSAEANKEVTMKIDKLKEYISTGREIEFAFNDKMYSITYSYDGNMQTIHFCEFNKKSQTFDSIDTFLAEAMLEEHLLCKSIGWVEDVVVY